VAATPVTLCAIDEKLFHEFLIAEDRVEEMRNLWRVRSELEKFPPFSEFSDTVNDRIARNSVRLRVASGDTLVEQGKNDGEFFIILSGEFRVMHNGVEIKTLSAGDMFGEYGSLADTARNATVTAVRDSVVLEIARGEIRKVIESAPIFHFCMKEIMIQRSRELKKLEKQGKDK
jgi:CRP-like cAMP-binding protein